MTCCEEPKILHNEDDVLKMTGRFNRYAHQRQGWAFSLRLPCCPGRPRPLLRLLLALLLPALSFGEAIPLSCARSRATPPLSAAGPMRAQRFSPPKKSGVGCPVTHAHCQQQACRFHSSANACMPFLGQVCWSLHDPLWGLALSGQRQSCSPASLQSAAGLTGGQQLGIGGQDARAALDRVKAQAGRRLGRRGRRPACQHGARVGPACTRLCLH